MPLPGLRWRHVVISTLHSWLPGDERGFRSKDRKIHSGGDYRNPPPLGEHAGLLRYSRSISGDPVVIPQSHRPIVGRAILAKLRKLGFRAVALAVAGMHAHLLVELPDEVKRIKQLIGQCKTVSSHAIRDALPGRVWGHDGGYKPVDDTAHQRNVYRYILRQKGAWVWSFKDGEWVNPS